MKNSIIAVCALVATSFALPSQPSSYNSQRSGSTKWIPGPTNGTDELARQGTKQLKAYLKTHATNSSCTLETAYRRKEWDTLSAPQKKDYIKAVRCLQTKPTISPVHLVPGARSRYDDFVASHILATENKTMTIHVTGNFLTWHRYFLLTYETALREECGYRGHHPYVNWGRYSNSVIGSPLFDGSETSISDNGAYLPHNPVYVGTAPNFTYAFLPQEGGGCVQNGPFKDYVVNLGPVPPTNTDGINNTAPNPRKDGRGYNPRCMKRDLSIQAAAGTSDFNSTKLIRDNHNIADFQTEMQNPLTTGVHGNGHYIVGGDPGGDFYTSPGDPWFFLHHAQIDRTYWIWQNLGLPERWSEIAGTLTMGNKPPSRKARLGDVLDLGVNSEGLEEVTIGDALNTMKGPFCYVYE